MIEDADLEQRGACINRVMGLAEHHGLLDPEEGWSAIFLVEDHPSFGDMLAWRLRAEEDLARTQARQA